VTLVLRRTDAPFPMLLGAAGVCRVGLCEIVGCFGRGPFTRIIFLGGKCS
jgi:hypothetical protein